MTLNFYDFPYDFNSERNLVAECFLDLEQNLEESALIDIYGSYPSTRGFTRGMKYLNSRRSSRGMIDWLNIQNGFRVPIHRNAKNLWWTFENRRPPSGIFDGTISFDLDDYASTNFYLPLIYQYLDISGTGSSYVKHKKTIKECMVSREVTLNEKYTSKSFVSVFMNNPHPMRLRVIEELSRHGKVEIFGRFSGVYVANKLEVASKFRFNLCFENDLYPGYVTEKVLEAWLSESIPLYWGDDANKLLNPKAMVNLKDFPDVKTFIEYVVHLDNRPDLQQEILNEPLFAKEIKYSDLKEFIFRLVS